MPTLNSTGCADTGAILISGRSRTTAVRRSRLRNRNARMFASRKSAVTLAGPPGLVHNRRDCDQQRARNMAFSSRHGIVGLINPTMRPGPTEELIRLLPEGIGVIPLFLNIREGTTAEFKRVVASYEPQVALLAEQKCDLIHLIGAPPFMVLGRKAETKLIAAWQKKYRTPIFTVPQNHIRRAQRAQGEEYRRRNVFSGEPQQGVRRI